MSFAVLIVRLVQPAHHNDIVGVLCLLHSLCNELVSGAVVLQILTCLHSIIFARHVSHIASGIINLCQTSEFGSQSVEWKRLTLHLQRRRTAADGHHLDGVFAYNEYALRLVAVDGQHVVAVLEKHDALVCYLTGCFVVRFRAEEAVRTLSVHRRTEEEAQHTAHLVVKFSCGVLAALDTFKIWCGKIIVIVSVACAC